MKPTCPLIVNNDVVGGCAAECHPLPFDESDDGLADNGIMNKQVVGRCHDENLSEHQAPCTGL